MATSNGSLTNGISRRLRPLYPGVYVPLPSFFNDVEDLDLQSFKSHLLAMCSLGMIPVVAGSLGEAVHLRPEERQLLIVTAREALDGAGLEEVPIVAGIGGLSTWETVKFGQEAIAAGADAGMVIPPAYYAATLNVDQDQVVAHFKAIGQQLELPILLYNFPSNAGGIDLSSTTLKSIIEQVPQVVGVKLTCPGSMGKLIRLRQYIQGNPGLTSSRPYPILLLDGLIADLVPWTHCGGDGTVSGLMNFVPHCCMRLWELCLKERRSALSASESEERRMLQATLGEVDVAAVPGGIRAMKYALNKLRSYPLYPRLPLLPFSDKQGLEFLRILEPPLVLERKYEQQTSSANQ